jgi:hypothetical protein
MNLYLLHEFFCVGAAYLEQHFGRCVFQEQLAVGVHYQVKIFSLNVREKLPLFELGTVEVKDL